VIRALGEARRFVAIARFELRLLPARVWLERTGGLSLDALERVAAASFVVVDQADDPRIAATVQAHDQEVAAWLVASAARVAPGGVSSAFIEPPRLGMTVAALPDHAPASLRVALEARELLQLEIENAVAVPT